MTDRLDQIIFCMGNGGVFPLDREDCEWLIAEIERLREEALLMQEQHRADHRDIDQAEIALAICNSESFMWLMVGSNHQELQLKNLRRAWSAFLGAGGGWGKR